MVWLKSRPSAHIIGELKLSLLSWLVYIGVGKLLIYLGMSFKLPQRIEKFQTIKYWHECDLCFGTWVYGFLAFFMHMDLLSLLGFFYVPILSELITGGCISFLMHLLTLGWKEKFYPTIVISSSDEKD
jgi:hypothetical protein